MATAVEPPPVTAELKDGVPFLSVTLRPKALSDRQLLQGLKSKLPEGYKEQVGKKEATTKSCVVVLDTKVAGSALVRALWTIRDAVVENDGQLRVVGYPRDYIPTLSALGLLRAEGFRLSGSEEEALEESRKPG